MDEEKVLRNHDQKLVPTNLSLETNGTSLDNGPKDHCPNVNFFDPIDHMIGFGASSIVPSSTRKKGRWPKHGFSCPNDYGPNLAFLVRITMV
jgi:hypothetical protein